MDYISRHELLDRAYLAAEYASSSLLDHPGFSTLSDDDRELAESAVESLGALYARLGHYEALDDLDG